MPSSPLGPSADSSYANSIPPAIEIRSLGPNDDATAFRTLNEEWITRYFTLEASAKRPLRIQVDATDTVHKVFSVIEFIPLRGESFGSLPVVPNVVFPPISMRVLAQHHFSHHRTLVGSALERCLICACRTKAFILADLTN